MERPVASISLGSLAKSGTAVLAGQRPPGLKKLVPKSSCTMSPPPVGVTTTWCWVRVATKEYHTSSSATPLVLAARALPVAPATVPVVGLRGEAGTMAWSLVQRSLAGGAGGLSRHTVKAPVAAVVGVPLKLYTRT